jgi:hypothetical protein
LSVKCKNILIIINYMIKSSFLSIFWIWRFSDY